MNDETNIIYNPLILCLFTNDFDVIKKKYNNEQFKWSNYFGIFDYLYLKISDNNIEIENFIKYYYILTFIYLAYTNYLVYINHPDATNENLEKLVNKIKTSSSVVKNLMRFSYNDNIYKIIKLNDIFISGKIKKKINSSNIQKYIQDYIFDLKQSDKISNLSNDNYKKILNLVIYRYILCKKNNYKNYHELYLKKIVGKNNIYNIQTQLDFNNFMEQIPISKKILNIESSKKLNINIEISIYKLINYILTNWNDDFYLNSKSISNTIIIQNKKYKGQIKINISNKFNNIEFNQYQTNYNFLHYKIKELEQFNFLKKTFANIEINIFSDILKDFSSIMEFMHLIILSIKILSNNPSDIYECLYPIEYSNYYFTTFCYFLNFFKKEINTNSNFNKFIIDVIKFLYIYSYYDYYFYFSNDFVETLINNLQYKNEMFIEFTQNLKKTLKLPIEFNDFPPFFSQEFDINAIIYYNFEIPGYFKLFDFINAVYFVFELKSFDKLNIHNNSTKLNKFIKLNNFNLFDLIINNININIHTNNNTTSTNSTNSTNSTDSSYSTNSIDTNISNKKNNKKELVSNLDTEIINILDDKEKTQMENKNAYVELTFKTKNENILDTDY